MSLHIHTYEMNRFFKRLQFIKYDTTRKKTIALEIKLFIKLF
jgi:hypothetical protein